jgi:hypothetical protein
MSLFIKAGDSIYSNKTKGENDENQLSTTGNSCIDMFFNVNRDTSEERMKEHIKSMINESELTELNQSDHVVDIFLTVFQLRALRGMGKGEKKLFYISINELYKYYPLTILSLINDIPYYGCFVDLLEIAVYKDCDNLLKLECIKVFSKQLMEDKAKLDNKDLNISLAFKWAPRENKYFDKKGELVRIFCNILFPDIKSYKESRKKYRHFLKYSNYLKIPEVLMSANKWSQINFNKVPSLCLNNNRKAFLNEHLSKTLTIQEENSGNRFPKDEERIKCRKNLINNVVKGKINAKELFPHIIIKKLINHTSNNSNLSYTENILIKKQWEIIKESVLNNLCEKKEKCSLGNIVPIVDVSASMFCDNFTPISVSIAMGILVSEITNEEFKDRIITFESNPTWVNLESCNNIIEKVKKVKNASWGGSTNLEATFDMILSIVTEKKLIQEQIPNLIIFSDMQFDECLGYGNKWDTMYTKIKLRFSETGEKMNGIPLNPPMIIFWNLRGNSYSGIHAPVTDETENVQLLSGFSPQMLRLILEGELGEENIIVEKEDKYGNIIVETEKKKVTPYDTWRKSIDRDVFDRIRIKLSDSIEKNLNNYYFK